MRRLAMIALFAFPLALQAQASTVSPGMSRAQVVAALGEPATARVASEYTYLLYPNDCGRACGMSDLVVLRRDSVVDAIFRSPVRHYTGTSSSPTAEVREAARSGSRRRGLTTGAVARQNADPAAAAQRGASWSSAPAVPATPAATPAKAAPATPAATAAKAAPATPAATAAKAAPAAAASAPATPATAATAATPAAPAHSVPAEKLKPSAPSDTRPSVPAGEPPVRKSPATPAAPAPAPAPKPTPKPAP
jgi:hypothetical protein